MRTYFLVRQSCYSFLRETICRAGKELVHQLPTNCTQRLADACNCLLLVAHRLPTSCAACWASGDREATFMARWTSGWERPSWRAASLWPRFSYLGSGCATCAGWFFPTNLHHSSTSLPLVAFHPEVLRQLAAKLLSPQTCATCASLSPCNRL